MTEVTLLAAARHTLFRQLATRRENGFLRQLRDSGSCAGSRFVAYFGSAGLANRLRAHVIASAYAERTGRTLVPCWVSNKHLGCVYSDLFDFDGLAGIHFQTIRRVGYARNIVAPQGDVADYAEDLVFFKTQWQDVHSEYLLRSAKPYCDSFANWLKPRGEVTSFVERLAESWPGNVLGVHVRRGDFVTHTGQAISQSRYIVAMGRALAEMPDSTGVFLSTDAPAQELQQIHDGFRERIVPRTYRSELFEGARGSLSGARGSLADMLLLARCSSLILTPGSTFGEFAAQISNAPVIYA